MIYTHVLNKPGLSVQIPADRKAGISVWGHLTREHQPTLSAGLDRPLGLNVRENRTTTKRSVAFRVGMNDAAAEQKRERFLVGGEFVRWA
jgi:hypothetical protein